MSKSPGGPQHFWPCPWWQKAVGSSGQCWWYAMPEMHDARLLMPVAGGKGVSAGDKGKPLYKQHTRDVASDYWEEHKHFHSKREKRQPWLILYENSNSVVQVVILMYHSHPHYSLSDVPLHPKARNNFLLIFNLRCYWLYLLGLTLTFNIPGETGKKAVFWLEGGRFLCHFRHGLPT